MFRSMEFQPNVVVLLTGAWDLLDRKINGQYYSPGTVTFDRYFLAELDRATELLASTGRRGRGAHHTVLLAPRAGGSDRS